MARTKTGSGIEQHQIDTVTVLDSTAVDTVNRNQLAINQQFGLELYNRERVESEIRFFMGQSTEAMLNVGKLLIQLKENEQQGDWLISLERIGLETRLAQRMMKAAVKFSNAALTPHLIQAAGNKTKLFELLVLDDEELVELSTGESLAGLKLDDVAKMTTTELRAALRKIRNDSAESVRVKDKVIGQKDVMINKLSEQVETLKGDKKIDDFATARFIPVGTEELEAIQKLTLHINAEIGGGLRHKIDALFNAYAGDYPPSAMCLAAAHAIGQMITTLHDVAGDYHIMPETEFVNATKDPAQANAEAMVNFKTNGGLDKLNAEVLAANERRKAEKEAIDAPAYQQVDAWEDEVDAFDFDAPLDDE